MKMFHVWMLLVAATSMSGCVTTKAHNEALAKEVANCADKTERLGSFNQVDADGNLIPLK